MNRLLIKGYDYVDYTTGRYKYKLSMQQSIMTSIKGVIVDHDFFKLSVDGMLTVRSGYCWDGSSGPTWDTISSMRASLFHDALYQMMRESLLPVIWRKVSDKLYHNVCIDDGMWRIRAWYQYKAVRIFGARNASPYN